MAAWAAFLGLAPVALVARILLIPETVGRCSDQLLDTPPLAVVAVVLFPPFMVRTEERRAADLDRTPRAVRVVGAESDSPREVLPGVLVELARMAVVVVPVRAVPVLPA